MTRSWKKVTKLEVAQWRKWRAEGMTVMAIARRSNRSGHSIVSDYLSGERQLDRPRGPRGPTMCANSKCGAKGTTRLPLVQNGDGKHRCPECGGRWRAAKTLAKIRAELQVAQRECK